MNIITIGKNQTIVETDDSYTFFSYDTKIACYFKMCGVIEVGKKWDFSRTTLKHFEKFINDYTNMDYCGHDMFEMVLNDESNIDYIIKGDY